MSTRGRNKTGPGRDEGVKKQLQEEVRDGRSLRPDEVRELQTPGGTRPSPGAPEGVLTGGAPPGMTARDRELRAELAQNLGRSVYPADRNAVLGTLRRNNAPDRLVNLVEDLPEGKRFDNIQGIAKALGLGVEDHRT